MVWKSCIRSNISFFSQILWRNSTATLSCIPPKAKRKAFIWPCERSWFRGGLYGPNGLVASKLPSGLHCQRHVYVLPEPNYIPIGYFTASVLWDQPTNGSQLWSFGRIDWTWGMSLGKKNSFHWLRKDWKYFKTDQTKHTEHWIDWRFSQKLIAIFDHEQHSNVLKEALLDGARI